MTTNAPFSTPTSSSVRSGVVVGDALRPSRRAWPGSPRWRSGPSRCRVRRPPRRAASVASSDATVDGRRVRGRRRAIAARRGRGARPGAARREVEHGVDVGRASRAAPPRGTGAGARPAPRCGARAGRADARRSSKRRPTLRRRLDDDRSATTARLSQQLDGVLARAGRAVRASGSRTLAARGALQRRDRLRAGSRCAGTAGRRSSDRGAAAARASGRTPRPRRA